MSRIHFFEKGQGKPLILIHGFCETGEMWQDITKSLSSFYRVICPDLPGVGNSKLTGETISLEEIAVLLEEWMDEHNIQNPIVIGHSLGGYVTLALAELMGQKIKAIGLFHSTAFSDTEEKKGIRDRTILFLQKYGVDNFVTSFIPPLFPESRREELRLRIQVAIEQAKNCSLEGLVALTKAMKNRKNRFEVLHNFSGPTLFIAGDLDTAVPLEASRAHKEAVTHYVELANTGHVGMIERKPETIEILREFCNSSL